MALSDESYLLFTTFRRDGTPVSTAVWVVDLGEGSMGFWTSSGSGKAKRLAHTSRVTLQPCDGRGRVKKDSSPVQASARLVQGDELQAIRAKVISKYGFQTKVTKALAKLVWLAQGKRIPTAIAAW
ncbi:MAG TPA: PPOX class F420-dependent oxidoreductase [Solirubrobacteraceae bacterium]|nr:PPOX class F420-dependent oxidoreductase [Solirubrobacteraceae bacterium]